MNQVEDTEYINYTMGLQKKLTINRQKEQVGQIYFKLKTTKVSRNKIL